MMPNIKLMRKAAHANQKYEVYKCFCAASNDYNAKWHFLPDSGLFMCALYYKDNLVNFFLSK